MTGGPGAAVVAVVAVGGLGWVGGVGHCGRLGTLCNGSRPRGAAGAAAGGGAKRSIRAWGRGGVVRVLAYRVGAMVRATT